ncbi:hypothetical protein AB8Z38_02305 [Bradyrhizobium sp. LLZ17]|uniref:Uncharacterized protein n=1 Tax=Bradyrhizobium sp. LLZ17 TaxID=3239388 RepID=A0AB39XNX4_9BRAD
MNQKNEHPAAVATAGGARGIAVFSQNTNIAQTVASANSPSITSIRRGPGGWAEWVVSIKGDVCAEVHVVCTDVPVSDQCLRTSKRFCNVLWYRFGVNFNPMPQSAWSAIVEAAIAKGGAS